MDYPFNNPVILSLCTGLHGLERGLERAIGQFTVAAYCEIESFICANLVAGMEAGILASAPIWTDVKTFPSEQFHGRIHGIVGGYPCQPFSNAGKRGGTEDPRHLWPYILNHIGAIRPLWCFFENVPGHLTMGYEQVRRELQEAGYGVTEGIYSAAEVGAPHQRKRLFILAVDNAACNRHESQYQIQPGRNGIIDSGKMANTAGHGHDGAQDGQSHYPRGHGNKTGTGDVQQPAGCRSTGIDEELADNDCIKLQERETERLWKQQPAPPGNSGADQWPAGPGKKQSDWEAPRTIEPGLGVTINGYNFREDLLRALGNSVVEQQAEFAFRHLLKKHYGH